MKELNFYNILFFLPIVASVLFIIVDYTLIPKVVSNTSVEIAHFYSHKKGNPCKVSINVTSKWGNEVFETKNVSDSLCRAGYNDIAITHTKYLRRWLLITSDSKKHYLPDNDFYMDALFIGIASLSVYGFYTNNIKKYYDYPNVVLFGIFVISIFYFYNNITRHYS